MTGERAVDRPLVLVVDDEAGIRRALGAALTARGLAVTTAATGAEARAQLTSQPVDIVILDLGLPDVDGVALCREMRMTTSVPIIVLTAEGSEARKVEALDEGADDYVTKPFSTPELLARVRVALRHRAATSGVGEAQPEVFEVGDVVVDVPRHRATLAGHPLVLTPKEFAFLAALARQPGRVLTHRALLKEVWGPEYGRETQYLRVFASQIRKKLQDDPARPRLVTEPGVGYRLVDPTDPDAD